MFQYKQVFGKMTRAVGMTCCVSSFMIYILLLVILTLKIKEQLV